MKKLFRVETVCLYLKMQERQLSLSFAHKIFIPPMKENHFLNFNNNGIDTSLRLE